jgi:glyoxylase-like metal-dependent hydrolase (beta-lactamase superfamily II)
VQEAARGAEAQAASVSEEIAPGVHRLGTEWVNFYVLEAGDALVAIDCGFRRYARRLDAPDRVAAVVLTHYHPDHGGAAASSGAPVLAPAGDLEGVRTGKVSPPPGLLANGWRPAMARYSLHAVRNGGTSAPPVPGARGYAEGDVPDLPVRLRAIHTPGHTAGHCSLLAPDHGVLFTGDALANVGFYDRRPGVQCLPFNEDAEQAARSVERLAGLDAAVVAFGHGAPFRGRPADAVAQASADGARSRT